ncbi:MarR family winged helix-turn-helix transcriptional regulator [Gryllotalpicola koreensis]|uniref:MarR family transcriptional regulator n=1 Tax=Gryllotalpicola koreensis TaxID=993086 RepID=A0ABP7ZXY9_9MICO
MPLPSHANDRTPDRVKKRPSWLVGRAHATSLGLLVSAFEASGTGLRPFHYRILSALEQWGAESQAALGRDTGIDPSDMTAALVELEAREFVTRRVDPAHKRRNIVTITASGERMLRELDHVIEGVQLTLLAPLDADEQRQFTELLTRILTREK